MAIQESFTDQAEAVTTPGVMANTTSDVIITGDFSGNVHAQLRPVGSVSDDDWLTFISKTGRFSDVALTPDGTTQYRFKVTNIVGTVNVYMGE